MSEYAHTKWAVLNGTVSGDWTVVEGVSGKKIRVVEVTFTCSADVAVAWHSNANVVVPAMSFAANGGMDLNRNDGGAMWCETNEGESLIINLSTNSNVRGSIIYALV